MVNMESPPIEIAVPGIGGIGAYRSSRVVLKLLLKGVGPRLSKSIELGLDRPSLGVEPPRVEVPGSLSIAMSSSVESRFTEADGVLRSPTPPREKISCDATVKVLSLKGFLFWSSESFSSVDGAGSDFLMSLFILGARRRMRVWMIRMVEKMRHDTESQSAGMRLISLPLYCSHFSVASSPY
jgi:hypothetical protein